MSSPLTQSSWSQFLDPLIAGVGDVDGALTVDGDAAGREERARLGGRAGRVRAGRDAIETATDRLAAPLVATLGARALELVEAMRPLAERIMAAGEVPKPNNMGLPWPSQ